MKKILFITCVLGLIASSAYAHDVAKRFGLGFDKAVGFDVDADVGPVLDNLPNSLGTPLGFRYWFGPKLGLDVGFGFSIDDEGDEDLTSLAISAGLPINILQVGDRVNMHFLPWVQYSSLDLGDETASLIDIVAGLEFEVFVTNDLSVSVIQGVDFQMLSPPDPADSQTDINAFGGNLTNFGVHYYLGGGTD